MSALTSDTPPKDDWTSSDLEKFPEDGVRRELFNGVMHVTPSPSSIHQTLAMLLGVALTQSCPEELFVSQANEVELAPKEVYIPDLLVINFEAAKSGCGKFPAADVVLAAEIVSPSTKGTDRVTKPSGYAHAGIPHFWLIETLGGLEITAFELNRGTQSYDEVAVFSGDDTIRLDQPWPIEIPLASVRPRNL
ncbi:Uma2 family endonuclease [Actinoplanes sp. NPDC049596]|uniref:Uma2 family endonuclease n=1 Tax=unclassified Actinoplanes TaxID=2626549 RepID=UPI0034476190